MKKLKKIKLPLFFLKNNFTNPRKTEKPFLLVLAASALSACGGGGSGNVNFTVNSGKSNSGNSNNSDHFSPFLFH